jgi:hypothetical protein
MQLCRSKNVRVNSGMIPTRVEREKKKVLRLVMP